MGETTPSVEPVHLQVERPLERGHLIRQRAVRRAELEVADHEQLRPLCRAVYLDTTQYICRLPGARLVYCLEQPVADVVAELVAQHGDLIFPLRRVDGREVSDDGLLHARHLIVARLVRRLDARLARLLPRPGERADAGAARARLLRLAFSRHGADARAVRAHADVGAVEDKQLPRTVGFSVKCPKLGHVFYFHYKVCTFPTMGAGSTRCIIPCFSGAMTVDIVSGPRLRVGKHVPGGSLTAQRRISIDLAVLDISALG